MISTDINALNAIARGEINPQIGPTLMTTTPYPIYYRMITKCGCTFIMNLLYYLNYGQTNHDPFVVHDKNYIIPKADAASNPDIADSPYAFVVMRDPVKRFMSLYFDKLYGKPRKNETFNLGEYFIQSGLVAQNIGDNADKHRENCMRTILWIKQNLAGKTDQSVNWHWKPQKFRLNQIHKLRFNVLTLEDINFQLPEVLKPLIPQITHAMETVSAQNISQKPVRPEAVMNDELHGLICDIYAQDIKIYHEVTNYWHAYKENHKWQKNPTNAISTAG